MSGLEIYQKKAEGYAAEVKSLTRQLATNAVLRLLVVLGAIIGFFVLQPFLGNWIYWIFPIGFTAFVILARITARLGKAKEYNSQLLAINQKEIQGLEGDFSSFNDGKEYIDFEHPFSHDLDLFGSSSLFQRINRCCTDSGEALLALWLTGPDKAKKTIVQRQEFVNELADKLDWRQDFLATGANLYRASKSQAELAQWAEEPDLLQSPLIRVVSYVLPLATIALWTLAVMGILPYVPAVVLSIVNLVVVSSQSQKIGKTHAVVGKQHETLAAYADLLGIIEKAEFSCDLAKEHHSRITADGTSPGKSIKELASILRNFNMRTSPFVSLTVNSLLMWDFHCVLKLGKWKNNNKSEFEKWFSTISFFDGMISLANLAYNHKEFVYPTVAAERSLECKNLGHPFLDKSVRIGNDISILDNRVNIVTGANMAGKSTFLRSIGTNLILGMAGAPVCADKMHFYPINLYTSLRTTDSVVSGESYFFAELKRLERIVKAYEAGEELFVLLDEILKGTNTQDQHLGAKGMVARMIELNGFGLCATHDVELAKWAEQEYPQLLKNFCFEIELNGTELIFDYTLKPGICQTMNASILLRKRGIIK